MKAYEIKCPECGAAIEVDGDRDKVFCTYCGTQIALDDGIDRKEVTHRYVDEAEITRSNNEVELQRMAYENEKRRDNIKKGIIIGCTIMFIILMAFIYITGM